MTSNKQKTTVGHIAVAFLLVFATCFSGLAQERMPPIPADKWTDAQKQAVAEFSAARGMPPTNGPFAVLLRSPEVMNRARALSDYLRMKGVLPPRLRQLAILLTARQWTAQFEWAVQYQQSMKVGLTPEIGKAIADGRRPDHMDEEEGIVYDFCMELQHNQSVSDATYNRAVAKLGEQGVVEMVSTVGYFTLLGMVLSTARTPAAPSSTSTSDVAVPPITPLPR